MDFVSIDNLREHGFEGFLTVAELAERYREIPDAMGVYLVVTPDGFDPQYVERGTGGFFKGRDPNVSAAILSTAWVKGARVINIGKAGGASSSSTLRKRLRQYIRFGQGQAVGHWGGRYIWQLHGCHSLLICWKATEVEPRDVERDLIATFRKKFGARPFANLQD
ncbi:hypothetical protein MRBLMC3_003217 [Sphingobium sp. LMC3-1-1.1]|uniref:hypothetical protein n=1 Tax=Sphingobium sp. LMC3-1-1.1 TaxID=3135241 RepID=UPI003441D73C